MRKTAFCICENKDADQLISAFVFAIRIVQSLYYLHPKIQASSHLLWLYRPVCVGPGRKPRRPVVSHNEAHLNLSCRYSLLGEVLLMNTHEKFLWKIEK